MLSDIGPFSNQAIVVIVVYVFAIIVSFTQSNFGIGLMWIFVLPIITYDINCLTYGQCNSWSWLRVFLSVLPLIIYSLYSMFFKESPTSIKQPRQKQQEEVDEQE